ncbi:chemotaxis protein CheX [Puniceicoccaceae bacterium K14]|nr:chemotaxis protein CheX [Puniceicoccaceae bacterium K14]
MPASIPIEKVQEFLSSSLIKVIETMMRTNCTLKGCKGYEGKKVYSPSFGPNPETAPRVFASSVGFAGDMSGVCYLFMAETFAFEAAKKITGLDDEDLDADVVRDVCGELTNMFAGTFKNSLADLGIPSTLTIPTVVQGKRMAISTPGSADQFRFKFEAEGYPIFADLLVSDRN